jgi:hypothetical protein
MDLNVTLADGKLTTSLYAKPMALHLYILPSSCHTPGLTMGLIHGHFYRLFMLCSHERDIEHEIYSLPTLIPIFLNAEQKARSRHAQQLCLQNNHHMGLPHDPQYTASATRTPLYSVLLHLQGYHPSNPSSSVIQKLWRQHMLMPRDEPPLYHLTNRAGHPMDIRGLIVAYSWAPNLGNILSCRKISDMNNLAPHNNLWYGSYDSFTLLVSTRHNRTSAVLRVLTNGQTVSLFLLEWMKYTHPSLKGGSIISFISFLSFLFSARSTWTEDTSQSCTEQHTLSEKGHMPSRTKLHHLLDPSFIYQ